jgi:hypothetical protein
MLWISIESNGVSVTVTPALNIAFNKFILTYDFDSVTATVTTY